MIELSNDLSVLQVDYGQRLIEIFLRSNQITRADRPEILTAQMLDLMIEISQAETAFFFLFDPATDNLVITCIRGDDESLGLIGMRLKKHLGIVGASISEAQPIIVSDLHGDSRWLRIFDPKRAGQLENAISLPLSVNGMLFGAIQIFNYQCLEPDLLMVLGQRLASDLDRLIQIEEIQSTNQRLNELINVLGQVAGTMDRDLLLQFVTESASKLVDAERSSVYLVEKGNEDLSYQVSYRSQTDAIHRSDPAVPPTKELYKLARKHLIQKSNCAESSPLSATYFTTQSALSIPLTGAHLDAATRQSKKDRNVIGGLLAINKRGAYFTAHDAQLLEVLASQTSTFLQIAELYEQSNDLFLDVLKTLVAFIDAKDPYTQGHSLRVSDLSVGIAQELGFDQETINDVRIGSLLHDVGKIGIPDHILKKKGRLTPKEFEEVKNHPRIGGNLIGQVRVLNNVLPAIAEHHERLNGSGYPLGISSNQISMMGRIVAVADVFDAMSTDRPYRKAIVTQEVLENLHENAGTMFDADCVNSLDRMIQRNTNLS
jgi:HD-GYP domain-containing protein (c-di-GMP phosphodiesterase class II)